jgi:hypothetical protein
MEDFERYSSAAELSSNWKPIGENNAILSVNPKFNKKPLDGKTSLAPPKTLLWGSKFRFVETDELNFGTFSVWFYDSMEETGPFLVLLSPRSHDGLAMGIGFVPWKSKTSYCLINREGWQIMPLVPRSEGWHKIEWQLGTATLPSLKMNFDGKSALENIEANKIYTYPLGAHSLLFFNPWGETNEPPTSGIYLDYFSSPAE